MSQYIGDTWDLRTQGISSRKEAGSRGIRASRRSPEGSGAAFDGGEEELGDVLDLDLFAGCAIGLFGGQAVGQHDSAEGAAGGDLVGAGGDGFVGAVEVDPGADLFFHPHPGAAGAAAER